MTDADAETYLRSGITPTEVVRLAWPQATDAQARYVLWEFTPYPLTEGLLDLVDAVASARARIGADLPTVDDSFGTVGHRNHEMSAA